MSLALVEKKRKLAKSQTLVAEILRALFSSSNHDAHYHRGDKVPSVVIGSTAVELKLLKLSVKETC